MGIDLEEVWYDEGEGEGPPSAPAWSGPCSLTPREASVSVPLPPALPLHLLSLPSQPSCPCWSLCGICWVRTATLLGSQGQELRGAGREASSSHKPTVEGLRACCLPCPLGSTPQAMALVTSREIREDGVISLWREEALDKTKWAVL